MRTLLSHDATAKWSDWEENEISEILSSGGFSRRTSLERSPKVLLWVAAALLDPNNPDILDV